MKTILILTLILFFLFSTYNYVIKPVDFELILNDNQKQNNELELQIVQKNKLNLETPFRIDNIQIKIIEGKDLVEIISVNSKTLKLRPLNFDREGKILIQFSIPEKRIKKVFEFYISSQKV